MKTGNINARGWCYRLLLNILLAWAMGLALGTTPCLTLQHCEAAPSSDTDRTQKGHHKSSKKVKEFQERLNQLLAPVSYIYSPAGKPDPFQPFIKNKPAVRLTEKEPITKQKPARAGKCSTPLECMDVGQLRLVAIVLEDSGSSIAMAQDASGIGYILKKGMRIGYRNGHVTEILPDRVVVQEEAENIRGEMTLTNRVLFLHPEEK